MDSICWRIKVQINLCNIFTHSWRSSWLWGCVCCHFQAEWLSAAKCTLSTPSLSPGSRKKQNKLTVCLPFAPPLLQILDVRNVMVVVSRWYGGILLGPDRFKHINNCARNILVEEGYAASTVRLSPGLLWITLSSSTDTSSVKLGRAVSSPVAGKHLLYCIVCD